METNQTTGQDTPLTALDKLEIMELAARFEVALDKENAENFVGVFTDEGKIIAFGSVSEGPEQLREAMYQMLNAFARDRRHCTTNAIIEGDGREAVMNSYLIVFNRSDLGRTGSAAVKDTAVKLNGKWLLKSREIDVDPSFQLFLQQKNGGK